MTNNQNNKNVFTKSLGSVGRLKGNWQNYPQGSPEEDQRNGQIMEMKAKKIQSTPPPNLAETSLDEKQKDYIISSLEMELQFLNYKNFTQYAQSNDHKRMVNYFRSTIQKRIIGCHLICETLKEKWTLLSELHQIYNINRSMISSVIKECLEEGWFISKIREDKASQLCYRCNDLMLQRTADYNIWKFKKGNNSKIINFVKNYNNSVLDDIIL